MPKVSLLTGLKSTSSPSPSTENHNKQIFHAFLFNIRNYSPEVIDLTKGD